MDSAQQIALLLSSLGIGGVLMVLVQALVKWLTGSAAREKLRNTDLRSQLSEALRDKDRADERADSEAARRRRAEEAASAYRRQLIEAGIDPGPWPLARSDNKEKK